MKSTWRQGRQLHIVSYHTSEKGKHKRNRRVTFHGQILRLRQQGLTGSPCSWLPFMRYDSPPPPPQIHFVTPLHAMKQVSASLPPRGSSFSPSLHMEFGVPSHCNTHCFIIPRHSTWLSQGTVWYVIIYLHVSLPHHIVRYLRAWIFVLFIV